MHYINLKGKIILSPQENHTVAAGAGPGDLGLKSHPKDYQQKLAYRVIHLSTNRGRCCLTPLYQAVGRSSMPITIDHCVPQTSDSHLLITLPSGALCFVLAFLVTSLPWALRSHLACLALKIFEKT